MTIKETLAWLKSFLQAYEEPSLEASFLLSAFLKKDRAYLYTHETKTLTLDEINHLKVWAEKRQQKIPLAYLTGEKSFWDFTLKVNEHTLIPRPETECLIETVLNFLPEKESISVADLGTGSGAIALTLKRMRHLWQVFALDISTEALLVAKENATRLNVDVHFDESDWTHALPANSMEALISNPPYLIENDPHFAGEIAFEPRLALAAGEDGMAAYRAILSDAKRVLKPKGFLFFEHGKGQAPLLKTLLQTAGYTIVSAVQDYQKHDRVLVAQYG